MYQQPGWPAYVPPPPKKKMSGWLIALLVLAGCGVVGVPVVAVLAAILFPAFAQAREAARRTLCMSHEKQIATSLMMYAEDYDQTLPPSASWEAGLTGLSGERVLTCPSRRDASDGYAYNALLDHRSLKRVPSPSLTPMVFESSLDRPNAADKLQSFVRPHRNTGNVTFADGHVRAVASPPHATDGLARRSSGSR